VHHLPLAVNLGHGHGLAGGQGVGDDGEGVHLVRDGEEHEEGARLAELGEVRDEAADAFAGLAAIFRAQPGEPSGDFFSRLRFLQASSLSLICFSTPSSVGS